jgi:cytidylate kinase
MNRSAPVVTIDGPSGAGKGTVARLLAQELGYRLLDSGAIYRILALAAHDASVGPDDIAGLSDLAASLEVEFRLNESGSETQVLLSDQPITDRIRTEIVGNLASRIAVIPEVRLALLGLQHGFRKPPGLVADGRDMGTVVFPDAELKIFLTATPRERAQRRYKQLMVKGIGVSLPALVREIEQRDRRDADRTLAPLRPAGDAITVDSTGMSVDQVLACLLSLVRETLSEDGVVR